MIQNIVFMGTPDFARIILQAMLDEGMPVSAVFTQPDKARGRSGKLQMTPVRELAVSAGIPSYTPVKIRESENIELLRRINPDVIVVAAFGQILPAAILEIPRYGCINVHASLLPDYRGAAPVQWAVIDGAKKSGVTIMRMDEGLDTGDMIMKAEVPIAEDETGESLFDKLAPAGASLLVKALKAIEDGTAVFEKQPEKSPTHYASMLKKSMGRIDWADEAVSIERRVRGLNSWPGAYTYLDGKSLKIWRAAVADAENDAALPGSVLKAQKGRLLVKCGSGALDILELQLEGKKRMAAADFLRGYQIPEGTILDPENKE